MKNKYWSWLVFIIGLGAYIPLLIGSWGHPSEINIACFGLWIILSFTATWSSWVQGFPGWRMLLGFLFGNTVVVVIALVRGGYTFNIGLAETIVIYGMTVTIGAWCVIGAITRSWNARILYFGSIIADVMSFYPQLKQYLLPHEPPTRSMIVAWCMFGLTALINFVCVEQLFTKLAMSEAQYTKEYNRPKKSKWLIVEESAFSIENFVLISTTVILMCR